MPDEPANRSSSVMANYLICGQTPVNGDGTFYQLYSLNVQVSNNQKEYDWLQ